jgi:gliding motility-associated-like protein
MKDKIDFYFFFQNKMWYRIVAIAFFLLFHASNLSAQTQAAAMVEKNGSEQLTGLYDSSQPDIFLQKEESSAIDILPTGFPVNKEEFTEAVDKRTLTSRTLTNGKGGIVIQYSSKNLHYIDQQNKLQSTDSRLHTIDKAMHEWAALQQQYPTYLYADGSTALSSEQERKIYFNRNCTIDEQKISLKNYTVGENGMHMENVISGVNKNIFFSENKIETDYILRQKPDLNNENLIISEELVLPEGYRIEPFPITPSPQEKGGKWTGCNLSFNNIKTPQLIVYSSDNKEQARFNTPIFYDANKTALLGEYHLIQEQGKIILEIIVPAEWLNAPDRVYPVTIDPVVTGPVSNYPSVYMNSCVLPTYQTDSMLVTIPAGITITGFIVEDSYFADVLSSPPALMKHGKMKLSTSCGTVTFSCQGTAADSSGTCYLVPNTDLKTDLACCFTPSCTDQTFYIAHGLGRDSYGPGCNQTYIYYSPVSNWPFSAYIIGKTVETTQTQWSVFPTTVCSDSCTVYLKVSTKYGVPPYTISHPWATGGSTYGLSTGSCSSIGGDTIALAIPGCPTTCGINQTLNIPPPEIMDICGNTVTGLSSKSISVKPVPVATVNNLEACSGLPFTIPVTSCVTGSSFQWTGSNGSSGTGDINDVSINTGSTPIQLNYTIIPDANGCTGGPASVTANVNPLPIITGSPNDTIDPGIGVPLTATGGLTYSWLPFTGLSCTTCPAPIAAPVITTSYYVTGTNGYGCSGSDTIEVYVNQGTEVLYIPNSFSPNDNDINDLFCVYGSSIKKINVLIYDRWGELLFQSTDMNLGWDGKYKGKNVEGGVYVYSVVCEWMSGGHTKRTGTVTVLR